MRIVSLVVLVFLSVTVLHAEYIRSIRIGSFPTKSDAELSLQAINDFINEHPNIVQLQDETGFYFKTRASGKYFITLAEPFTDRKVLQEVLDTLRLAYPDIYVTKLKSIPTREKKLDIAPVSDAETVIDKGPSVQVEEAEPVEDSVESDNEDVIIINGIEDEPQETLEDEPKSVIVEERKAVVPLEEREQVDKESSNLFEIISGIFLLIIVALLRYLLRYKKENELLKNQKIIHEEKLEQVKERLNVKNRLLSHVSHELRTPMTAIMGFTHLVLESKLTQIQQDYIHKIESSSEYLLSLINDILDVSKIQAGELKLEKAEFNINDVLDYVLSVNAMHAKRNSVSLSMDVALDIPSKVIGDSLRLGQVLINLIGNAVKFTKNGEVVLSVKKVSSFADGIKLEFSVSDTGIGMSDDEVENIFNSYYQADDSISRKFGGTGLGLAISRDLVEMMGGDIRVSSLKDIGTTFTFTAKLHLKDAQNKRQYRLPSASMLHKKILIVDSSNKNIISLIKALGYFNYATNSITTLDESSLKDDSQFDIIMINHYSITKETIHILKNLQRRMKSKIVILNDFYSNVDVKLFEDLHIDAYLQIPATQQHVLNLIIDLYVTKNLDNHSRKKSMKDKFRALEKKKILIAEDNDVNQKVIQGLFAQTGIETIFVDDGQEAVDLVRKDVHFDLLIMDINMPNMNGYEASKEIRKSSKYNALPILALTGDVMEDAVGKAISSGMQGHIAKPIIVDIFYKKIYDILSNPKQDVVDKALLNINNNKSADGFNELSVSVGLGRCHGDIDFYKSILQDFKSMYMHSSVTFEELCKAGKFKEARRMSMDIKDVALNIGAYNLCESAATMEYEFEKGKRSNYKEFISFYDAILSKLIRDIDKYLRLG